MVQNIQWTGGYVSLSRQEWIHQLARHLSRDRLDHVLRVEATGLDLAKAYGGDPERVSIAALFHDACKEMDKKQMYQWAQAYWSHPSLKAGGPAIWHGLAAAHLARDQYGCQDWSILQAIAWHTIAYYDLDLVGQIIYTADYIEPGRSFKGVAKARKLAWSDLHQAVKYQMRESIRHLAKKEEKIFVESIKIYNHWMTL